MAYSPKDWGRARSAWNYIWALMKYEPIYGWWYSGDVPPDAPAWGDNSPPPDPSDVGNLFCAAVGNLMIRALGMFDEGYVIPNIGNEHYDGGTVAWVAYYKGYGTLRDFDLETAQTYEGTVCLRGFRDEALDQGHFMLTAYYEDDGQMYALQSYPDDASGEPGLNWDYTVEESHYSRNPYEYEYMVMPWDWLPISKEEYLAASNGVTPDPDPTETTLTKQMLVSAMTSNSFAGPDLDPADADAYFPHFVKACEKWEINTRARLSALIAQTGAESGSWQWWREFNRGEGEPFGIWYGRGPMQLTWEANYSNFQDATGYGAHDDPEVVADDAETGFQSAGWFWRNGSGDLNELADLATWQAFYEITGRVWGSAGPFAERDNRYQRAWDVLPENVTLPDLSDHRPPPPVKPPIDPTPSEPEVYELRGWYGYPDMESDDLKKFPPTKSR